MNAPSAQEPEPPKRGWESRQKDLTAFISSPMNRIFILGFLGMVYYVYHGHTQHRWRMTEMQRRIDGNIFLSMVQKLFGAGKVR